MTETSNISSAPVITHNRSNGEEYFFIINIILLSANTNLLFWSRRPHLGNELCILPHMLNYLHILSYVCVNRPIRPVSMGKVYFSMSELSLLCRRCHLALLHALGHVLVYRLSCTREQVESSMSNSSAVLSFFCLLHSTLPSRSG
jgi:hypothetical protein